MNEEASRQTASRLKFPSSTILLVDGGSVVDAAVDPLQWQPEESSPFVARAWVDPNMTSTGQGASDFGGPLAQHNEKCPLLWVDGHVKAMSIPDFFDVAANTPFNKMRCFDVLRGCA